MNVLRLMHKTLSDEDIGTTLGADAKGYYMLGAQTYHRLGRAPHKRS